MLSRASPCARFGPGRQTRGNVADRFGVAEIIAHELFDRQQAVDLPIAVQLGDAELFGPIEHLGRLSGVKMHFVAQVQEKLTRGSQRVEVFFDQNAQFGQFVEIGRAIADKTDPSNELDIAQSAAGTLDVRLQQKHGFAEAESFCPAGIARFGRSKTGCGD